MTDCEVVPRCVKIPVPSDFVVGLETLSQKCIETAKTMLKHRDMLSSKHWKDVPCVVAKGLSVVFISEGSNALRLCPRWGDGRWR